MENIDLFDKYIRDEMSEIEKQDFDNRLITDSDFAEEFRSYQLLVTGLKFSNQEAIFKQMDDLEEGLKRKNKVRVISLIGSVAAIFIGVIFFLNPSISNPNEDVFSEYYTSYDSPSEIDRDIAELTVTDSALWYYQTRDFGRSVELFKRIVVDTSTELLFFSGLSMLEEGDFTNAFNRIITATDDANYIFHEDVLWYAMLISVKLNKKKEIEQFARQLIEYNGRYSDRVDLIISRLNK